MTADTRALRIVAEAALIDSEPAWTYVDGPLVGDVHVETRPQSPGRSKIRVDPNAVGPFIAAASPGTILALLDEVDRLRARPWERLRELGYEVDETGVKRQHVMEREIVALRAAIAEAVALFDSAWCPEHGHAPRADQITRIEELRKLVKP